MEHGEFVYCDEHEGEHYQQSDCVWRIQLPTGALDALLKGKKKMMTRCYKFEKHEPHAFGKDMATFCSGQVAYR
jgi:hypothetical protein